MQALRKTTRRIRRASERFSLHARLQLTTLDGKPVAPLSRCRDISLSGIRVSAAEGLAPGTMLLLSLELPTGRTFRGTGRVAWLLTTLRPTLLGTPTGRDDDAIFGIAFDGTSTDELLPIARLLAAREHERRRARRIGRLHHLRIHA
ncbi:MAG: PilZ domain-containing protein [Myxococcales bacterium]|nr:PilZ domain-containing protein [Myxococcales bacterium]HIL79745.1 PilZ domain-containing protein [Myxococcales bacterium]